MYAYTKVVEQIGFGRLTWWTKTARNRNMQTKVGKRVRSTQTQRRVGRGRSIMDAKITANVGAGGAWLTVKSPTMRRRRKKIIEVVFPPERLQQALTEIRCQSSALITNLTNLSHFNMRRRGVAVGALGGTKDEEKKGWRGGHDSHTACVCAE